MPVELVRLRGGRGRGCHQNRDAQATYQADIPFTGQYERSLVLGEVYRRNGGFRFRVTMQGFMAGIPALNETYGLRLETTRPVRLEGPN